MTNLLAELSRRKVIRVAAAYGIVSWVVLQVVSLLAPEIGLPEGTVALVLVILLAGFPVALFLSWAFELTPDGIVRNVNPKGTTASSARLDVALIGVLAALAAMSALGIILAQRGGLAPEAPPRLAIAVLPFADMSPEGDQGWFSDGMSEEIIHRLVKEKKLTVTDRTSSFYFKDKNVPIGEIGELLNVSTVLEGSVRKFRNRIRITAQLIDIESGSHRWSGTYDRELKDVFAIQDELSNAIASELLKEMGLEPTHRQGLSYQPDLAAYQLYLRGQQLRQTPTYDATIEAVRLFREAADLDENYVAPLVSLLALLAWYEGNLLVEDDLYNADAIVGEAMLRDPAPVEITSLKAHAAIREWRFDEAEAYFREYVRLVDTVAARGGLGIFLVHTGRAVEAIPLIEAALEQSPLNDVMRVWLAAAYNGAGRYADTLAFIDELNASGLPAPSPIEISAVSAALAVRDRERVIEASDKLSRLLGVPADGYFLLVFDNDRETLAKYRDGLRAYYEQYGETSALMGLAETSLILGDESSALEWIKPCNRRQRVSFRIVMSEPGSRFVQFLLSSSEGRELIKRAGYDLAWYGNTVPDDVGE